MGAGRLARLRHGRHTRAALVLWPDADDRAGQGGEGASKRRRLAPAGRDDDLASWLANVKLSRSPLTHRRYAQHINAYAVPNIGKIRLDDLDGNRIAKLYDTLLLRDVSADQIQKLRKALRRVQRRGRS